MLGGPSRPQLASQPSAPSRTAPALLTQAAAAERQVDVPRWSHQTRRRPPVADAASLVRLCRRVLEAAAGTVPLDELARSIAPRLGLAPTPLAEANDDRAPFDRTPPPLLRGGRTHAVGFPAIRRGRERVYSLDARRLLDVTGGLLRWFRLPRASRSRWCAERSRGTGVGPNGNRGPKTGECPIPNRMSSVTILGRLQRMRFESAAFYSTRYAQ